MMNDAWRAYWRGRFFLWIRRPEQAAQALRDALSADPGHVPSLRWLGFCHGQRKEFTDAARYLAQAVAREPNDAHTWFNLGYARDQLGDTTGAIEAFEAALRLKPKLDQAWYGLGLAHARRGDHAAAVRALEEAALLEPRNPHVWHALGMAHHHAHAPDKVAAVAKHLVRFDPRMARHLIQETERADLAYLVAELRV